MSGEELRAAAPSTPELSEHDIVVADDDYPGVHWCRTHKQTSDVCLRAAPSTEPALNVLAKALHDEDLIGVCFHESSGTGFAGSERTCIRHARAILARLAESQA